VLLGCVLLDGALLGCVSLGWMLLGGVLMVSALLGWVLLGGALLGFVLIGGALTGVDSVTPAGSVASTIAAVLRCESGGGVVVAPRPLSESSQPRPWASPPSASADPAR
jgi:hypothetical protein